LSGSPVTTATVGNSYVFQPVASDADGDNLNFGIQNKPAWMGFNSVTGRLTGTPTAAESGKTYSGIVISVTDGQKTKSLNAFSLTIKSTSNPAQLGAVSLSWTAPVARADGNALSMSEIAGYNIYYGTKAGSYTKAISINNASSSSATIDDLPLGTYYVVMTTRDTTGVESSYSTSVSKQAK
jgi:hypothetical protein